MSAQSIHTVIPKISVVIPVYNAELYFEACLQSVISQSLQEIEIILVNDGATDSTPAIIRKYASADPRIVVIEQENQGTQYARLAGLKRATGEYIQTLDCDDTLEPGVLEKLYAEAQKTGADMVVSDFYFNYVDPPAHVVRSQPLDFKETTGPDLFRRICLQKAYWATWTRLFKRSFVSEHSLVVHPEIMSCEDTVFSTQFCMLAGKVVYFPIPVVRFTVRNDSLSNSRIISDKRYRDLKLYPVFIESFLKEKGQAERFEREIAALKVRVIVESFARYRFDEAAAKCRYIRTTLKKYPEFTALLSRRYRKIVKVFHFSSALGYLNLWRYKRQNKL